MNEKSVRMNKGGTMKVEQRAELIYRIIFEGLAFATLERLEEVAKMLEIEEAQKPSD